MGRVASVCAGAALIARAISSAGALARETAPRAESAGRAPAGVSPLQHFLLSGIACLVRGDPDGAAHVFAVTDQLADLPQMHYLLALARILADFDRRADALPLVQRAIREDPGHPVYALLEVLADAHLSTLRSDGALYLTPAGAERLRAAARALPAASDTYNGKYAAVLLSRLEPTGDVALPLRWSGFKAMLGPGRSIALPGIKEPQALGRLLVVTAPQLAAYEVRFVNGALLERRSELDRRLAP